MAVQLIKILVFYCLCCNFIKTNNAAKILGLFPSPSKSHLILGHELFKGLAQAGHEVTLVSPFPLNENITNYRDIQIRDLRHDMLSKADETKVTFLDMFNGNPFQLMKTIFDFGTTMTELALQDAKIQEIFNSNEKFDIIISATFMNEAFLAFADRFNTHVIGFSTLGASVMTNSFVGNPSPYAYVPHVFLGFNDHMTFYERLVNTVVSVYSDLLYYYIYLPKQELLRQKYLPNTKPLKERLNNVSLILLNSHASLLSPRPLVPNMIEIGGFHIRTSKSLPSDLQTVLDTATNGVIYFSLGSNMRSQDVTEDIKEALIQCLSQVKQTVLWKWDDDNLSSKYKHIIIRKWFPQRDILVHPNVRLFITHGGLLSTTESISAGVPMIGIPLFADQKLNMNIAKSFGYALPLDYKNITSTSFCWAIQEVLDNSKYKEEVKKRSLLLNDRIVKPIDEAIYWVEYVLRHNGAAHLKTARNDLQLYQYLLLDVIVVILIVFILFILIMYWICTKFWYKLKELCKKKLENKEKIQ